MHEYCDIYCYLDVCYIPAVYSTSLASQVRNTWKYSSAITVESTTFANMYTTMDYYWHGIYAFIHRYTALVSNWQRRRIDHMVVSKLDCILERLFLQVAAIHHLTKHCPRTGSLNIPIYSLTCLRYTVQVLTGNLRLQSSLLVCFRDEGMDHYYRDESDRRPPPLQYQHRPVYDYVPYVNEFPFNSHQ